MKKRIIYIKDELELIRIKRVLGESSIDFDLIEKGDSVFRGIGGNHLFELYIDDNDYEKIKDLVDENIITKSIEYQEETRGIRINIWTIMLFVYAIGMTIMFIKYFNINKRNSVDKNFSYEWNYNNTILTQKHKRTKEVTSKYYDLNRDGNYEEVETYSRSKLISVSEDKNENGIFEKVISYSYDMNLSLVNLDNNEDGNYEIMKGYIREILTSVTEDINENGIFEKNELYDFDGNISGTNLDINEDGIFEDVTLISEDGVKLKLIDSDNNGSFKIIE